LANEDGYILNIGLHRVGISQNIKNM
jgi:hypothetical protein